MITSLIFGAAFSLPAAPVPRETTPVPVGPAPWVVHISATATDRFPLVVFKTQKVTQVRLVTSVENGNLVTKQVREEIERLTPTLVSLGASSASFSTVRGTSLAPDAVSKMAKTGFVALVSADGKPIDKAWLRAVEPETVVITAQGLASPIAPRPLAQFPTAAPRVALLSAGSGGKVQVAFCPAAEAGAGNVIMGRGRRVVFMNNGGVNQPIFLNDGPYGGDAPLVSSEVPVKPLEDVNFEAFELSGAPVTRETTLRRLKAGGLVLIAGDNRMPDPAFLKQFRGDLLVIASEELANIPVKGSKAGGDKGTPIPAPVILPAVPLKALRPAVAPPPAPVKKG